MEVTLLILPFHHSTSNSFSKNCVLISSNINVEDSEFQSFLLSVHYHNLKNTGRCDKMSFGAADVPLNPHIHKHTIGLS